MNELEKLGYELEKNPLQGEGGSFYYIKAEEGFGLVILTINTQLKRAYKEVDAYHDTAPAFPLDEMKAVVSILEDLK